MGMSKQRVLDVSRDEAEVLRGRQDHGCGCTQVGSGGEASIGSPCACAGVERVVRRTHRLNASDALKVGLFVALLAGVVFALWR
jgi:hypothetical protein